MSNCHTRTQARAPPQTVAGSRAHTQMHMCTQDYLHPFSKTQIILSDRWAVRELPSNFQKEKFSFLTHVSTHPSHSDKMSLLIDNEALCLMHIHDMFIYAYVCENKRGEMWDRQHSSPTTFTNALQACTFLPANASCCFWVPWPFHKAKRLCKVSAALHMSASVHFLFHTHHFHFTSPLLTEEQRRDTGTRRHTLPV